MRNLGSPDQQNSQVTAPHHRLRPNRVLSQVKVFGFEDIVEAHRRWSRAWPSEKWLSR
jgi:hypothetical protein